MAFTANVPAALRQLGAILKKVLALQEWEKLALEELKPGTAPGFDPHTSQLCDIRSEASGLYDYFLMLASEIRAVLKRSDFACTTDDRSAWQHRLDYLERKMAAVHGGARFIKP